MGHQMVPDMLVANLKFLNSLSPEEYQVFKDAALLSTQVEMRSGIRASWRPKRLRRTLTWAEFIDGTWTRSRKKVLPLTSRDVESNPKIRISTSTSARPTKTRRRTGKCRRFNTRTRIMQALGVVIVALFMLMIDQHSTRLSPVISSSAQHRVRRSC